MFWKGVGIYGRSTGEIIRVTRAAEKQIIYDDNFDENKKNNSSDKCPQKRPRNPSKNHCVEIRIHRISVNIFTSLIIKEGLQTWLNLRKITFSGVFSRKTTIKMHKVKLYTALETRQFRCSFIFLSVLLVLLYCKVQNEPITALEFLISHHVTNVFFASSFARAPGSYEYVNTPSCFQKRAVVQ